MKSEKKLFLNETPRVASESQAILDRRARWSEVRTVFEPLTTVRKERKSGVKDKKLKKEKKDEL